MNGYLSLALFLSIASAAYADDWQPIARKIPPPGIAIEQSDRQQLAAELARVESQLKQLAASRPELAPLVPDAAVYAKAVSLALRHGEFYRKQDVAAAAAALNTAQQRIDALAKGQHPWTMARGLVVRGYESPIDGSVQPYGLVIPAAIDLSKPVPLYVWLHGRGDKTTDLHFIHRRQSSAGQIAPDDAMVLHPFGRHCIGYKSAGEVDILDAIRSVSSRYKIDADRIALMGFSMGGAGAWHVGAHYADRFAAVHAGAGFAETRLYNKLQPADYPAWYVQKLWSLYDVPNYTRNLFNLPVVAYSGEQDRQIQAARVMEEAYQKHGKTLPHLIGPGMGHRYHPDSLKEVMRRMGEAVRKGRDRYPKQVMLQTRTLRYPRMHWVELLGLEEHWSDARVDAHVEGDDLLVVKTKNVRTLRLQPPWPGKPRFPAGFRVMIDGQTVPFDQPKPSVALTKAARWIRLEASSPPSPYEKRPGLQGPIDDVLLEPFLVVTPNGKSQHAAVERWVQFELAHFQARWRALYRGELRTKPADEVTADDLKRYHLILWGDADSNIVIKRVADQLPLRWTAESIGAGEQQFDAKTHVPVLIHPNPANPQKYLVLNSGPTHREGHDRTNSLQNPKLPDWAVIDVRVSPGAEQPGRIVAADFFDEFWRLKKSREAAP